MGTCVIITNQVVNLLETAQFGFRSSAKGSRQSAVIPLDIPNTKESNGMLTAA